MAGLSLSPPITELSITQDQKTVPVKIELVNDTPRTQIVDISPVDFGSLDNSGGIAFLGQQTSEGGNPYALASWLRVEERTLTMQPRETHTLTVWVDNDDRLGPGGHYGAVLIKSKNQESPASGNVMLSQALSSLIIVKKTGGERYVVELTDVRLSFSPLFGPRAANITLKNSGNVHITPRGIITTMDPLGRQVNKVVLNQASARILPGSSRTLIERVQPVAPLLVPGIYTTTVAYRYDGTDAFSTITRRTYTLGLPTLCLFIAIFCATLWKLSRHRAVQLWIKRSRRRFNHHHARTVL